VKEKAYDNDRNNPIPEQSSSKSFKTKCKRCPKQNEK